MLTLPETITIIKSLDTAPDIIAQACNKILGKDDKYEDAEDLATLIFHAFEPRVADPGDLMLAGVIIAGRIAGASVKPDKMHELVDGLRKIFIQYMSEALTNRFHKNLKRDPEEAIELLREILIKNRGK